MSRIISALKSALRFARGDTSAGRSTIVRVPAKPGTRERAILHAIRVLHDNAYGVAIQQELERAKISIAYGAMYVHLEWLERNGFVRSSLPGDGRKKKTFTLTSRGEEALRG